MRVVFAAAIGLLICGCDDGPDLIGPPEAKETPVVSGCAPPTPTQQSDAGSCECTDAGDQIVVMPGCGVICGS